MNACRSIMTPLAALAASLLLATAAVAQTSAAKPAAKKAAPAAPVAPVAPAAAHAPLAPATGEQLAAADMTHYGEYACEFDQTIQIVVAPKHSGYVDVRFKAQSWTMKPILSSTGALRLEDVNGRMLMLQIANKSMLMDTKAGQRVVDGCVHEKQRLANADRPAGSTLLSGSSAPK